MALAININDLVNKQKIDLTEVSLRRVGILRVYTEFANYFDKLALTKQVIGKT
jgi:hypothetical protein